GQVPDWLREMPETALGGFWGVMRDFYLAETKIPNKYKELIGIAVSGATRCKYCALFHTEAARLFGATDDEIAEAGAMTGQTTLGNAHLTTILPAVNLERARRFYRETLGLREGRSTPEGGVVFAAGDGTDLEVLRRDNPTKAEHTALTFEVKNLDREIQDLEG